MGIVGCLAASLTSVHYMLVAPSSQGKKKKEKKRSSLLYQTPPEAKLPLVALQSLLPTRLSPSQGPEKEFQAPRFAPFPIALQIS